MDKTDEQFARELRRLREHRGIAQDELGRRAGLSAKYVGQVERGERGTTLRNAAKIAEALGVTLEAMIAAGRARGKAPRTSDPEAMYGPPIVLRRIVSMLRMIQIEEMETIEQLLETWRRRGSGRPSEPRSDESKSHR